MEILCSWPLSSSFSSSTSSSSSSSSFSVVVTPPSTVGDMSSEREHAHVHLSPSSSSTLPPSMSRKRPCPSSDVEGTKEVKAKTENKELILPSLKRAMRWTIPELVETLITADVILRYVRETQDKTCLSLPESACKYWKNVFARSLEDGRWTMEDFLHTSTLSNSAVDGDQVVATTVEKMVKDHPRDYKWVESCFHCCLDFFAKLKLQCEEDAQHEQPVKMFEMSTQRKEEAKTSKSECKPKEFKSKSKSKSKSKAKSKPKSNIPSATQMRKTDRIRDWAEYAVPDIEIIEHLTNVESSTLAESNVVSVNCRKYWINILVDSLEDYGIKCIAELVEKVDPVTSLIQGFAKRITEGHAYNQEWISDGIALMINAHDNIWGSEEDEESTSDSD